ncbi:efflux RND transporter periplasmic adaptor subunit [Aureimonas leprariae]|nr:efflux RND transporter periplasmic adaptor subunit [Aureimonas leprariae]
MFDMVSRIGVGIAVAAFLAGAGSARAETPAAAPVAPVAAPSIVVVEAKTGEVADRVIASGLVQAVEEVDVQPLIEGYAIDRLEADVGDRVEAGEVLATLSSDALTLEKSQIEATRAKTGATLLQVEAQIAEAQANADEARRVFERTQRLSGNGATSEAQVQQAKASADAAEGRLAAAREGVKVSEAEVKVAEAQLGDIELKLQRTSVKAPVAGIVSARNARVGAIARGTGDPLFTIIRDGAVELRADVAEGDVGRLRAGQAAKVSPIGAAEPLAGEVRLVEPTINATTRLGLVRISLGDASRIRPGMYADADVTVSRQAGVVVPITAVTADEGGEGASVLRLDGDHVAKVRVELGVRDNGLVVVRSGLSNGDRIVAKAGAFVRDGDRITPVLASDPLGAQAKR